MVWVVAGLVACGGSTNAGIGGDEADAGSVADTSTTMMADGQTPPAMDGATPPPPFDGSFPPDPGDGTPTRKACTGTLGNGLSTSHGRLDGTIVSIVQLDGSHTCNGDSTHVHLQVLMQNAVYDVAVNADTIVAERDIPIPGGAWAEGWHTSDALDYVQLGLHTSDFTQPASTAANAMQIEQELANANHVAVFGTGYSAQGMHLIHRQTGGGRDGAIVIDPLASTAHVLFFAFTNSAPF
jgi:hypothetical protein